MRKVSADSIRGAKSRMKESPGRVDRSIPAAVQGLPRSCHLLLPARPSGCGRDEGGSRARETLRHAHVHASGKATPPSNPAGLSGARRERRESARGSVRAPHAPRVAPRPERAPASHARRPGVYRARRAPGSQKERGQGGKPHGPARVPHSARWPPPARGPRVASGPRDPDGARGGWGRAGLGWPEESPLTGSSGAPGR